MPQNKKNWEEEFEKLFDTELRDNDGIFPNETETRTGIEVMEQIKSFISQQISLACKEEKKELREKIETLKPDLSYPNARNFYRKELNEEEKIYNQALQDILDLIK